MRSDNRGQSSLTNASALVTCDSATPGTVSAPIPITGIGSETIFDIDIRPADTQLYGLSSAGRIAGSI